MHSGASRANYSKQPKQLRAKALTHYERKETMEKIAAQTDTEAYNDVVDKSKHSLGNRLKFKMEFMFMMINAGRNDEAAKMYDQLIEEFDKLK